MYVQYFTNKYSIGWNGNIFISRIDGLVDKELVRNKQLLFIVY